MQIMLEFAEVYLSMSYAFIGHEMMLWKRWHAIDHDIHEARIKMADCMMMTGCTNIHDIDALCTVDDLASSIRRAMVRFLAGLSCQHCADDIISRTQYGTFWHSIGLLFKVDAVEDADLDLLDQVYVTLYTMATYDTVEAVRYEADASLLGAMTSDVRLNHFKSTLMANYWLIRASAFPETNIFLECACNPIEVPYTRYKVAFAHLKRLQNVFLV